MIFFEHIAHAFFGGHSHARTSQAGHGEEHRAHGPAASSTVLVHPAESSDPHKHRDVHLGTVEDGMGPPAADHAHDCVSRGPATNWLAASEAATARTTSIRLQVLAVLFEFG